MKAFDLAIRAKGDQQWAIRHNIAVVDYTERGSGVPRNERIVLDMARAIDTWFRNNPDEAVSGYGREHITAPMLDVFVNMLNLDLGRLDGGTLDAWFRDLAAEFEIDEVL
jgi:hypothetical protein